MNHPERNLAQTPAESQSLADWVRNAPQKFWCKVVRLCCEYEDLNSLEMDGCYRVCAQRSGTDKQLVHSFRFDCQADAIEFLKTIVRDNGAAGFASLDRAFWHTPSTVRADGWRKA